jgi:hypothetical protein
MPIIHYHNVPKKNEPMTLLTNFVNFLKSKDGKIFCIFFSRVNSNNFAILYYIFGKKKKKKKTTLDVNN